MGSNHAKGQIYQERNFLSKLSRVTFSTRGTIGKCLKTIPRVHPSHVREIGYDETVQKPADGVQPTVSLTID